MRSLHESHACTPNRVDRWNQPLGTKQPSTQTASSSESSVGREPNSCFLAFLVHVNIDTVDQFARSRQTLMKGIKGCILR